MLGVLSQCLGHGAVLPDTGKAQLPHRAFRDGIAQDRPAKWEAGWIGLQWGSPSSRQLSVLEAAVNGFGCYVGCDLMGRGELIYQLSAAGCVRS